jgi:hypothetical protein
LSYELELFALAVILYLYDSSVLLYSNEAVLACNRTRGWSAPTGWISFEWAGRSLCVLNPLTPGRPSFRLHWDFRSSKTGDEDPSWSSRAEEFKVLAPFCLAAGISLYILLPLGMFTRLGTYAIVPALILLYGSILLALIQLRRRNSVLAIGGKRFWGIVFESIACPPFAVNMVRHITLADRINDPLPLAAVRLLDEAQWSRLRERCLSIIDDEIQRVADDSVELMALESQKKRLSNLVSRI